MVNIMLMNNKFSKKNRLIYKMKCLNTRNQEYIEEENEDLSKIEKYK